MLDLSGDCARRTSPDRRQPPTRTAPTPQALQPMRDIRPMHGGPGYSEDMVMYVRGLNFELD